MKNKIATVFGGTGFVGRQIVRELAAKGVRVKVATRVPESAFFLRPCGDVGQVVPYFCDYKDDASLAQAVRGSDMVVNCIGILFERGFSNSFHRIHGELPAAIAAACKKEKVGRFVHISALGVDKGSSRYAQTKMEGEKGVLSNFPNATILRPSVVFGENDDFFNKFASLAQVLPFLPLIGGGETKFQPVFVGDVADAAMAALGGTDAEGQTYELGGPEVVSFEEIYEKLFAYTGRERGLLPLPFWLAKIQGFFFSLLPNPLLTPDQVESLKTDNVVSPDMPGFDALGLSATSMDTILPTYLKLYRQGGRFADLREA